MNLKDKLAIITGGGSGIGRAITVKMAEEGAIVVIVTRNMASAEETSNRVKELDGKFMIWKADVTIRNEVNEMVGEVLRRFNKIDILVNNVGRAYPEPFMENTDEYWEETINTNLKSVIYCSRAVLDSMIERRRGRIINIGSEAGKVGNMGTVVASACKGAINAFTKALAREMARHNILVNTVSVGPTDTQAAERFNGKWPGLLQKMISATPLKRLGKPEEIANMVAFLASDEASFITGQIISVSGGLTMV